MSHRRPAIVAHRGASAEHPENTLRAMLAALEGPAPADGFECDVRLTRDGVPVVFHDDDTLRLCERPGTIEARTLAEVRALTVRGEPIPTLAELLDATAPLTARIPGAVINIELKPTRAAAALVAACAPLLAPLTADPALQLIVSSFDPRVLRAAQAAAIPWRHAFLYETLAALRFLDYLAPSGPLDLHPPEELVSPEHLAAYAAPDRDRRFRVWTVDDPARARSLAALGVDAIITNHPARLRTALGALSHG
ncbi:MAG: glycerophosphodiester phosphodiesterase family protein [Myxococcota bacterium]